MKRKYSGVVIFFLLCCTALVLVIGAAKFTTRAGASGSGLEATPATNEVDALLSALEATVTDAMQLNECGEAEAGQLRTLAREEPERARQLEFIASHVEIYSQDAVKTALLGGDHIDFALELPFRAPDSSGLDSEVSVQAGAVPYMSQYDERWGYHAYGSSVMGITGCGPTCLAMVAAGLNGDGSINPARVADFAMANGYYAPGAGTTWSMFTDGAVHFGLSGVEIPLDEGVMHGCLDTGSVIVASMLPGDFTQSGHFIVIYGSSDGGFRVHDPNSTERSSQIWSYERLACQIANMWAMSRA